MVIKTKNRFTFLKHYGIIELTELIWKVRCDLHMNSEMFVGRKKEIERLDRCMDAKQAQLIIVYGRRRVGKTYLIDSYFDNKYAFSFSGAYNETVRTQLKNFSAELSAQTGSSYSIPSDWTEAFMMLRQYLTERETDSKNVVFFDEMPWLDSQKSGFLSAFEWFWNGWGSKQKNLVFIVCGSATSWMVEKIAENKGGLYNRQTCRLYLKPFSLYETEEYLKVQGIDWSRYDIAQCYMIMGGMPYYLSLLDNRKTLDENIDSLFFEKKGELWDEFEHLYKTLFKNSDQYVGIVEALSKKKNGMTRKEIIDATGLAPNGSLSKMLSNLINSGFIYPFNFYGHKKKDIIYKLCDYYSLFYFSFIKENYGRDPHFWRNMLDNPARRAWSGLTFEQVCLDHTSQIKKKLGIAGVLSSESMWYTKPDADKGISDGAQIDLLIDRRDHVVNICEIKYSDKEYEIDKDYDKQLHNKIDAFWKATQCKKTLTLSFISTYGVKKNKYSSIVRSQVTMDDLFEDVEE